MVSSFSISWDKQRKAEPHGLIEKKRIYLGQGSRLISGCWWEGQFKVTGIWQTWKWYKWESCHHGWEGARAVRGTPLPWRPDPGGGWWAVERAEGLNEEVTGYPGPLRWRLEVTGEEESGQLTARERWTDFKFDGNDTIGWLRSTQGLIGKHRQSAD